MRKKPPALDRFWTKSIEGKDKRRGTKFLLGVTQIFSRKFEEKLEGLEEVDERLKQTSLFIFKLLLAGLIFRAVLFFNPSTYQVQSAFANMMSWLLNASGIEAMNTGTRIFTEKSIYVIVQDCLGWKSMSMFVALVYASTQRTLEYANYILGGLTLLFAANIVRVYSTIYLAEAGIISFEVIHGFLWRWSLTVIVLGLWIYWLRQRKAEDRFEARIRSQMKEIKTG